MNSIPDNMRSNASIYSHTLRRTTSSTQYDDWGLAVIDARGCQRPAFPTALSYYFRGGHQGEEDLPEGKNSSTQ